VQAEVLETLDKREKQVVELESALKSLNSRLAAAEAHEKQLLQGQKSLDQVVAASSGREASLHAHRMHDSERNDQMLRTQLKRCHELQAKLQEEMRLKAEAEATAREAEARVMDIEDEKQKMQEASAKEIMQLNRELGRLRRDSDYTLRRMKAESNTTMDRSRLDREEAESLLLQLDEEQKLLTKTVEEKQELEHKLADALKLLATHKSAPEESDTLIRHLQEELRQCSADVAEARKLKQAHINAALLKEKLIGEKSRADRAEASLAGLADVQVRVKEMESELQCWSEVVEKIPGAQSRDDILPKFAALQREALAATAKTGELNAQVAELKIAVEKAETLKKQVEAQAEALREEVADATMSLKRLERKVGIISAERDGLKRILESYDKEEAVIASHRKPGEAMASISLPSNFKDQHIKELSLALTEAQQHATELEEALLQSNDSSREKQQKIDRLAEEVNEACEKVKSLEREGDRLRKELAGLELKLGRGEFNRATTKVLHLINNLESGDHSSKDVPVNVNNKMQSQEIAALTKQITSLEKRQDRYRQIFADKISLFREACYLLFGYKVQMHEEKDSSTQMPVTVFTLQSIYAQSDDDKLLFQLNSGRMDMLANDYTTSPELERQVRTFLKNFKSIPAFMANLTMELFNKTTIG